MNHSETLAQLGRGYASAMAYTGTKSIRKTADSLILQVNGKPGYKSYITIKLMPNDTYTVTYATLRGLELKQLDYFKHEEVYCDELQDVVERMYDGVINATNGGLIHLGA